MKTLYKGYTIDISPKGTITVIELGMVFATVYAAKIEIDSLVNDRKYFK
jgi:hypothetical protein